jgi:tryptophan synthase alpha chain
MIEIGMPYSDPIADGPIIQASSERALANGMTLELLFYQLKMLRNKVTIPVLLMGYINPMLQFGMDRFISLCSQVGIDGVILPDLPPQVFQNQYADKFKEAGLANILLISPQTSDERIRLLDQQGSGFLYAVSSASTTGGTFGISQEQLDYFERLGKLNLKNPHLIGFGISNQATFQAATKHSAGAIVGSAFVKFLSENDFEADLPTFIQSIKPEETPWS